MTTQDGEVDKQTIEEYLELEKKIASAETYSPALILQQKKDQLVIIRFASIPVSTFGLIVRVIWRRGSSSRREVVRPFRIRRRLCIIVYHFHFKLLTLCSFTHLFSGVSSSLCSILSFSKKEKQDVEDLEVPETKRLFLEQNALDAKKSKEQKEYLDALNKEVTLELSN